MTELPDYFPWPLIKPKHKSKVIHPQFGLGMTVHFNPLKRFTITAITSPGDSPFEYSGVVEHSNGNTYPTTFTEAQLLSMEMYRYYG